MGSTDLIFSVSINDLSFFTLCKLSLFFSEKYNYYFICLAFFPSSSQISSLFSQIFSLLHSHVLIYICGAALSLHGTGSWAPVEGGHLLNHSTVPTWSQLLGPGVAIKFRNSKIQDTGFYPRIFQGKTDKGD